MTQPSFAQLTDNLPHRPILEKALAYFGDLPKIAVDCGCGAGAESAFLLQQDFIVHAFDPSISAQEVCLKKFEGNQNFNFSNDIFENYKFPNASLIIALFSLFFCTPSSLNQVLKNIQYALAPHGIFLFQLLGTEDAWVKYHPEKFIGFEPHQFEYMFFHEFELLFIDEVKEDKPLASGHLKFWHVYTLLLKKKGE